jgi:hypothetical protein
LAKGEHLFAYLSIYTYYVIAVCYCYVVIVAVTTCRVAVVVCWLLLVVCWLRGCICGVAFCGVATPPPAPLFFVVAMLLLQGTAGTTPPALLHCWHYTAGTCTALFQWHLNPYRYYGIKQYCTIVYKYSCSLRMASGLD